MVLWILLFVGLALLLSAVVLAAAMVRADRRARRRLYQALGLADETVDLLMARSGDILTELSLIRMSPNARDAIALPGRPSNEASTSLAVSDAALPRTGSPSRYVRPVDAGGAAGARRRHRPNRRRL